MMKRLEGTGPSLAFCPMERPTPLPIGSLQPEMALHVGGGGPLGCVASLWQFVFAVHDDADFEMTLAALDKACAAGV